jgi:hypothetical protein
MQRVAGGKVVTTSGATDGPFVEAKEIVGGYMFVSADTVERAIEVAREMPMLMPGATIEIREVAAVLGDLHRRAGNLESAQRHRDRALASAPTEALRDLLGAGSRSRGICHC